MKGIEFGRVTYLSQSVAHLSFLLLVCELHGEQQRRLSTSPMSSADVPLCVNLGPLLNPTFYHLELF